VEAVAAKAWRPHDGNQARPRARSAKK